MLLNCEKDLGNALISEIDLDNVVDKWAKQVNNMHDVQLHDILLSYRLGATTA